MPEENRFTAACCALLHIFQIPFQQECAVIRESINVIFKPNVSSTEYNPVKRLERESGKQFSVVSSGHVSDTIEEQAAELNAVFNSGTDALILITNRLDINNEGDDVFIRNAEKLIKLLPENAKLGLYECPYPYKRLVKLYETNEVCDRLS